LEHNIDAMKGEQYFHLGKVVALQRQLTEIESLLSRLLVFFKLFLRVIMLGAKKSRPSRQGSQNQQIDRDVARGLNLHREAHNVVFLRQPSLLKIRQSRSAVNQTNSHTEGITQSTVESLQVDEQSNN
jgi:hypothetical protein